MSQHKNFVATNLSFFVAPEKCHDINFFAVEIFFALRSSTLSQNSLLCCDILFRVLLYLCCGRVSHNCMLLLSRQTFSLYRHSLVVLHC